MVRSGGRKFKNVVPVGEYMHRVGNYIVAKGDPGAVPRIGAVLFDDNGKKLGYVADVFGPVSAPYVLVKGKEARRYYARKGDLIRGG